MAPGICCTQPLDLPQSLLAVKTKPVPADYDGDGEKPTSPCFVTEPGICKEANRFTVSFSENQTDKPVVGDYDGDGKADVAVFRPFIELGIITATRFTGIHRLRTDVPKFRQ